MLADVVTIVGTQDIVFEKLIVNMFKYLFLSSLIFLIGSLGYLIVRKHVIMLLVSLELMLLSINMNLFIFSAYLDDIFGQFFSLFVLTVAAAESAVVWQFY